MLVGLGPVAAQGGPGSTGSDGSDTSGDYKAGEILVKFKAGASILSANALLDHLAAKLPVSRWQRDLTDSTVTRNVGVPFAHTLIALKSLQKGLGKLILNEEALRDDLEANWAVVAEAIQTILRREGYPRPYEALKDFTRTHAKIDRQAITEFIESLEVPRPLKEELLRITPESYTGIIAF